MLFAGSRVLVAVGVAWGGLADVLGPEEGSIGEVLKVVLGARALPAMLGGAIFQLILMALPWWAGAVAVFGGRWSPGVLPGLSARTVVLGRCRGSALSCCGSCFVRFCPFLAFLRFCCVLVFNLFTPSLACVSSHALSFLFAFVEGCGVVAEGLYFS